ncbi:MAG: prolyl oligopeptidase family serine peptidase [Bacteroidia bacterium]|nr:prolyl oligopeptidase family serine peptidase [Bacteroidia bacterium]
MRTIQLALLSFLLSLILILPAFGQDKSNHWTPEEIINTQYVSSPSFSYDGKMLVWSKKTGLKKEDKFVQKLFLTRLDVMKSDKPLTVQLTYGNSSERSAVFSPDGDYIYYLSSKEKGNKLWRLSIYGGESEKVHEFKNGISSMKWLDKDNIAFISNEGKTQYELEKEEIKDNVQVIEDLEHWKPYRIYAFNLKDKKVRRLTDNEQRVSTFAVSRDGKYLIARKTMSPHNATDGQPKPVCFLKDIEKGSTQIILEDVHAPGSFQFSPDHAGFYFTSESTSDTQWDGAGQTDLYYYTLATKSYQKVPLNWANGMSGGYYLSGDHLIVSLANGPLRKIKIYHKSGSSWTSIDADFGSMNEHVAILGVSMNGEKLLYNHSTAMQLPNYYVADLKNANDNKLTIVQPTEFISLNDKLKKKPKAKAEIIYWKGANDEQVNGVLYYPKNFEKGKKYPLILSIHGGPTGVDRDSWSERWSTYPQIYTDKGAFVLKPNYHGSGSHGQAFAESISKGKYYSLEEIDIKNGIDHLKEQGLIDMDKLGIMGWSNGAILTTWMTIKYPDMFKVAAPGAGDVNWTSDYGTCRFGVTFDQYYFGGAPWDDMNGKHYNEWYINNSPIFEIEKIKTPTIIFHGSNDRAVPRDQGWEYYRGLQQVGKAPVKFLWFPGQPHGLQKITHQVRKMKEEIRWIDNYLFKTYEAKNEAFKAKSPLAMAFNKAQASKSNGLYGVSLKGKLLPELVYLNSDSMNIGRFELTHAQYASFDKRHKYPAQEANHPVVNLSKDKIQNYLNWINKLTGEKYRLPNQKEAMKLHKKAHSNAAKENTLNYWAGYALTRDDAIQLKEKLANEKVDLVKSVGSFNPQKMGKEYLFDLGGNVAEYYMDGDELKVYGYDAHSFADPFDADYNESKIVGVRLIKD